MTVCVNQCLLASPFDCTQGHNKVSLHSEVFNAHYLSQSSHGMTFGLSLTHSNDRYQRLNLNSWCRTRFFP